MKFQAEMIGAYSLINIQIMICVSLFNYHIKWNSFVFLIKYFEIYSLVAVILNIDDLTYNNKRLYISNTEAFIHKLVPLSCLEWIKFIKSHILRRLVHSIIASISISINLIHIEFILKYGRECFIQVRIVNI
jgi:hypothetical protein